eukprot:s5064_g2.t1
MQEFRRMLQGWHADLPCLLGADVNDAVIWSAAPEQEDAGRVDIRPSAKVDKFLEAVAGVRVSPLAPRFCDRWIPTHYPRDVCREGRHIDCVCVRSLAAGPVHVDPEVRLHINTDHAMIHCEVEIEKTRGGKWRDSRARWVVDPDALYAPSSWKDVRDMALQCTRPRTKGCFSDDAETRDAIHAAKATAGTADAVDAWKEVHRLRKRKRRGWQRSRVQRILAGDWGAYRDQKTARKKYNWWGQLLRDKSAKEVGRDVQMHLSSKVKDPDINWDARLQERVAALKCPEAELVPIRVEELREALAAMRPRSALGPDKIGVDLLRCLCDAAPVELCELFTGVLRDGAIAMPSDWGVSLLALLPKVRWPEGPSDLRPIAMTSAAFKALSKVVMQRSFPQLRLPAPWSSSGHGRSCADLVGSLSRLRDITREWRLGMIVVKLDIRAAFDHLSREAVADYIHTNLTGCCLSFEERFLLLSLAENVLVGAAPGGAEVRIRANRGIRQGSPESAEIFGMLVAQIATSDDIFVWGGEPRLVGRNIQLLSDALRKVGLTLAANKTTVIASKYYKGADYVDIDGERVQIQPPGTSLRALGVDFDLDAPPSQQAQGLIGRVWGAFHEQKRILCGPGSFAEKNRMVRMLIEGVWSWIAGAVHWERSDLETMNSVQTRILRLCFGWKRLRGEDWVAYNLQLQIAAGCAPVDREQQL